MRTNIIQDMLLITNKDNYLSGDLDLNFTGSDCRILITRTHLKIKLLFKIHSLSLSLKLHEFYVKFTP